MEGLKVGHFTDNDHATGVTVFLLENLAVGTYLLCGSSPASHELAPLDPDSSVSNIHGLVFTGGSAYGLAVANGVMKYLAERGIGFPTRTGLIPIVPAVAIYDLNTNQPVPPIAEDAYQACLAAKENNQVTGRIGAGRGASVGKLVPEGRPMSGGVGFSQCILSNGIEVLAYVVVNAVGDVYEPSGNIVAGAQDAHGNFINCTDYVFNGNVENKLFSQSNTTLAAVFTNAKFSKAELKRIAKMAIAGMARAISPIFTPFDGDILFCVSLGNHQASPLTIGTIAAESVHLAILSAVKESEVLL